MPRMSLATPECQRCQRELKGRRTKAVRASVHQKYGRSEMATNIGTLPLPHCSSLMSGPISAIKGSRAAHSVKWRSGNFEANSNFMTNWDSQRWAEVRSHSFLPQQIMMFDIMLSIQMRFQLWRISQKSNTGIPTCTANGVFSLLLMKCYQNIRSAATSLSENLQPQKWSNFCQNLRMRKIHRGNPSAVANR